MEILVTAGHGHLTSFNKPETAAPFEVPALLAFEVLVNCRAALVGFAL